MAYFIACQMHGRKYQVIRSLTPELNNRLSEVRFDDFVSGLDQNLVQVNLFRRHCLGLDDRACPLLAREIQNLISCILRSTRPKELGTALGEVIGKLRNVLVEMIDRFPLGFGSCLPRGFPILESRFLFIPTLFVAFQRLAEVGCEFSRGGSELAFEDGRHLDST